LPRRAPQIEQEAEQQTTSPQREIQAVESVALPTRRLARNTMKQACFRYNGTQGHQYVVQVTGTPYAELDKKLELDVKEINEATLVQGYVNMVYCHLGFDKICTISRTYVHVLSLCHLYPLPVT
jgi:hypothetical protein